MELLAKQEIFCFEKMVFKLGILVVAIAVFSNSSMLMKTYANISVLKGYIVILVDNSSSCVILPTTFLELNESLSDYQLPPFIASINRLFRYFAILLAIFLLPTWFLMCINNYTPNNQIQIIENVNKNDLFFQLITIHIFINAINIASHNQTSLLSTPLLYLLQLFYQVLQYKQTY